MVGDPHTWDSTAVADPYVIQADGRLYLYYLGMNEVGVQRLGVAESPDGVNWDRSPANPILDVGASGTSDEHGPGEPAVAYAAPYFYMLYTGRSRTETRNLDAVSADGVHSKKMSTDGLLSTAQRPAWASRVICDPTMLATEPGRFRIWFGGGNKAEPGQNLNGQVGLMMVDLSQGRDVNSFDANSDWLHTVVRSTDALRGSFPIEGDSGHRFVWVGQSAAMTFTTGEPLVFHRLTLSGRVPAGMISAALRSPGKDVLQVIVNGQSLASQVFEADQDFMLQVPWSTLASAASDGDFVTVYITASRTFVPANVGLNADSRRIGFMVTNIRLR